MNFGTTDISVLRIYLRLLHREIFDDGDQAKT